ncbi:TPA: hypothetical protein ACWV7L_004902 [Salmonella enterica subsp. enterica serovar Muenchen]
MVQVSGHHGAGGAADALAPRLQLFRAPSLPVMGLRHMLCLRGETTLLLSNVDAGQPALPGDRGG